MFRIKYIQIIYSFMKKKTQTVSTMDSNNFQKLFFSAIFVY